MTGVGGDELTPDNLQVTVDLLGETDETLGQEVLDAAAGSNSTSLKTTRPISLQGAKSLVVNVSHPGYTSYSKRVSAAEVVYLNAELLAVEVVSVTAAPSTSVSGAVTDGFTLALPATGDEGDIQIAIPRSLLPSGTTSLSAELKSFDPNDPTDAQYFPGDYADSDGNDLVSVAFNYADIRTNDGQPLTALTKTPQLGRSLSSVMNAAAAEAAEPVIINRSIPSSSCATLERLGDANSETVGFQVPVYSYDSSRGIWDLLGYGTVFTSAGVRVDTVDGASCENGEYVLEIHVSSEIFLSNWWNLDYPLIFSEPVKYCARIRLQNENAQLLNGIYGFLYGATSQFGSTSFVTDEQGEAFVEVEAEEAGANLTGEIAVFGETNFYSQVTLGQDCTNPPVQIVTAQIPRLCQVQGKLEYPDGSAASKHPVLALPVTFALSDRIDFSSTNASGDYWLNTTCERDYTITAYSYTETHTITPVNVNGTTGAQEATDNGDLAILPALSVSYVPTTIYWAAYSTLENRFVSLAMGHPDNFPLRYNLRVENSAGTQLGAIEGEVALNQGVDDDLLPFWYLGFGQIDQSLSVTTNTATILYLKGTLTDSSDQTSNVDTSVLVTAGAIDLEGIDDEE